MPPFTLKRWQSLPTFMSNELSTVLMDASVTFFMTGFNLLGPAWHDSVVDPNPKNP
jgi:hypothetical protein